MTSTSKSLESRKPAKSLLSRLRSDASGNVIAMMAASMVPVVGLVGAGIDFSRMYLTRTSLQAACDAGVLAGRRQMGNGEWSANNNAANTIALKMFNANFPEGTAGSENVSKNFTSSGTAVTGSASAHVPTTLLQLFGNPATDVSVHCRADTGVQNTDVMFVLDTTGSMNWCANGSTSCTSAAGNRRIDGLKQATKCFYEALTKKDSPSANCGGTPSGATTNAQIRIGFMPYSTNVNVGKLLKNEWMADSWTYQSRQWGSAITTSHYSEVTTTTQGTAASIKSIGPYTTTPSNFVGTTSISTCTQYRGNGTCNRTANNITTDTSTVANFTTPTASSYTFNNTASLPSNANAASSSWIAATSSLQIGNTTYAPLNASQFVNSNNLVTAAGCAARNTSSPFNTYATMSTPVKSTPTMQTITPSYPNTGITQRWTQTQTSTATRYKWQWETASVTYYTNGWYPTTQTITGCRLYSQNSSQLSQTATWDYTATVVWNDPTTGSEIHETPVLVTSTTTVPGWTYKAVTFNNLGNLKAGGTSWNNSVNLPIGNQGTDTPVAWDGCIEERQTFRNADGNVNDDWDTIPTSAFDVDLVSVPTGNQATKWGYSLNSAVWGRYKTIINSTRNNRNRIKEWTLEDVNQVTDPGFDLMDPDGDVTLNRNTLYSCPTQAKKLQTWADGATFDTYVNSLSPSGNTYHDIGLIWGGRFLVKDGIFAEDNVNPSNGGEIERHMIFMTDGDTNTSVVNYAAYGLPWWDRRQTKQEDVPTNALQDDLVDARVQAICRAVKNQKITVWVVSFGTSVSADTKNKIKACATSEAHFFDTPTNAQLSSTFSQIGGMISGLRIVE